MKKRGITENTQPVYELNEEQFQGIFGGNKPSIETTEGLCKEKNELNPLNAAHKAYGEQFQAMAKKYYERAYKMDGEQGTKAAEMGTKYTELAAKTLSKVSN